ncbi:MAG: CDP-diacylglycerol--glycerol-3-phosphate 3-phosphatidyltransferase [Clostridiales bacterium]|nr:CDP-diacylglycerol--glycerol-3-phosphate 3-phosphatidyltransferase [Clostridiales bacterium]
MDSQKLKNVPNILSVIRILLVPVFVVLLLSGHNVAATIVFLAAGLTDVLDGYIARKYNCISTLGKVLDPLADKLIQASAFICLWVMNYIPWWMPVIYLIKEILTIIGASIVFTKKKSVVMSNVFGKLATVLVFGAIAVILLFKEKISPLAIMIICIAVASYFVISLGAYFIREFITRRKEKKAETGPQEEETE